jgi:hypothetical protein
MLCVYVASPAITVSVASPPTPLSEKEKYQDQYDCRHTQQPCKKIFAHVVSLIEMIGPA